MSEYNVVTSFQIMIADAVANLEQLISKYRKTIAVLEQGGELGAAKGLQKAKVYLEEYAASVKSRAAQIKDDYNRILAAQRQIEAGAIGGRVKGGLKGGFGEDLLTRRQAIGGANIGAEDLARVAAKVKEEYAKITAEAVKANSKMVQGAKEQLDLTIKRTQLEREVSRIRESGLTDVFSKRARVLAGASRQLRSQIEELRQAALQSVTQKQAKEHMATLISATNRLAKAKKDEGDIDAKLLAIERERAVVAAQLVRINSELSKAARTPGQEGKVVGLTERQAVAQRKQVNLQEKYNGLLDQGAVKHTELVRAQAAYNAVVSQDTSIQKLSGTFALMTQLQQKLLKVRELQATAFGGGDTSPEIRRLQRILELLNKIAERQRSMGGSQQQARVDQARAARLAVAFNETAEKAARVDMPQMFDPEVIRQNWLKKAPLLERTLVGAFRDMGRRFTATLQFAISGALIFGTQRLIREFVQTAIEVERAFADIESALEFDIPAPRGSLRFQNAVEKMRRQVLALAEDYNVLPTVANKAAFVMVSRFKDMDNAMKATRAQLLAIKISTIAETETLRALTAVAEGFAGAVVNTSSKLTLQERLLARETISARLYMQVLDQAVVIQQKWGVEVEDTLEGTARATETFRQMGFTMVQTTAMIASVSRELGLTGAQVAEKMNRWVGQLTSPQIRDQLIDLAATTDALTLSFKDFGTGAQAWKAITDQIDRVQLSNPKLAQQLIQIIGQRRELESVAAALATREQQQDIIQSSTTAAGAAERRFRFLKVTISEIVKSIATGFQELAQNVERLGLLTPLTMFLQTMDAILKAVNAVLKTVKSLVQFLNNIHIGNFGLGDAAASAIVLLATMRSIERVYIAMQAAAGFFSRGKGLFLGGLGGVAAGATASGILGPTGTALPATIESVGIGAIATKGLSRIVGGLAGIFGSLLRPIGRFDRAIEAQGGVVRSITATTAVLDGAFKKLVTSVGASAASGFVRGLGGKLVQKEVAGQGLSFATGAAASRAIGPALRRVFGALSGLLAAFGPEGALAAATGVVTSFVSGLGIAILGFHTLKTGLDAGKDALHELETAQRDAALSAKARLAGTGASEAQLAQEIARDRLANTQAAREAGVSGPFATAAQNMASVFLFAFNKEIKSSFIAGAGGSPGKAFKRALITSMNLGLVFNMREFIPASKEWWQAQESEARKAFLKAEVDVLQERLGGVFGLPGTGRGSGYMGLLSGLPDLLKQVDNAKTKKELATAEDDVNEYLSLVGGFMTKIGRDPATLEVTVKKLQKDMKAVNLRVQRGIISHEQAAREYVALQAQAIQLLIGAPGDVLESLQDQADQAELAAIQERIKGYDQRKSVLGMIASETFRRVRTIELLKEEIEKGGLQGDALVEVQIEYANALREQSDAVAERAIAIRQANLDAAKSAAAYEAAYDSLLGAMEERQQDLFRQRRIEEALQLGQQIIDGKSERALGIIERAARERVAKARLAGPIYARKLGIQQELITIDEKLASYYVSDADKLELQIRRRELLAEAAQRELDRLRAWYNVQAGVNDKQRELQGTLIALTKRLDLAANIYGANSTEYLNLQRSIEETQNQMALNEIELAVINAQLGMDISDPLTAAVASLAEIAAKLTAPDLGELEKARLLFAQKRAELDVAKTKIQDVLFDLKFQFDTGALGLSGYLGALRQMRDAVDITTRQGKELWEQINGLIEGLVGSANQAFNIPTEIRLPTLFEVRRALAADQLGVNYQDNRVQEVNVYVNDNVDAAQFARELDAVLGTSFANDTRRNAPGLAPLTLGSI